jgi:hypothetical protein
MPPDLVALGDQLEAAAGRMVARRRSRRQLVLNAAASILVTLPLTIAVGKDFSRPVIQTTATPVAPVVQPADSDWPVGRAARNPRDLALPRISGENLQHRANRRAVSPEMLELPSTLRPALR